MVLIGAGLGYAVTALAERLAVPLVVLDPFPTLASTFASRSAWPAPSSAVSVVGSVDAFERVVAGLARPGARPLVVIHPGYDEIVRFEARFVARALRRAAAPGARLRVEDAIVSPRALEALRRLPRHGSLAGLLGRHAKETAFVVAPGPSLGPCLPALAARRGGIVIAALQALRPLLGAGVQVDYVVAPDPLTYEPFLDGVDPRFGVLLADVAAPPGLLDRFEGRSALFALRSPQLHEIACERLGIPVIDEPLLTVSEVSVHLAAALGARDLVLLGVDYASEDERYDVRFRAAGGDGAPLPTNSHYFHGARYLGWRLPALVAEGVRVRRTRGGLRIPGAEPIAAGIVAAAAASAAPGAPVATPSWSEAQRARGAESVATLSREAAAATPRAGRGDAAGANRFAGFAPLPAQERTPALVQLVAELEAGPSC